MLPSCGTKKAFITLAEVSEKCSGTPAGTTSWLTLATPWSGIDEQPLPVERDDLDLERASRVRRRAWPGSSSCEPIQATPPRSMITRAGSPRRRARCGRRTPSRAGSAPGCWRRGTTRRRRRSRRSSARTIASMIASESIRMVRSACPTGPRGSRTAQWQAVRASGSSATAHRRAATRRRAPAPRRSADDDQKIQRAAWSDAASSACP